MRAKPVRIAKADTGRTAVDYFMIASMHGLMILGALGAIFGAVGTVAKFLKLIW